MKKEVLLILINNRKESAQKVQQILTGWGCLIKTRLGIHTDVLSHCSESGLIFIELAGGETDKHKEIERKLNLINGVDAKLVSLDAAK